MNHFKGRIKGFPIEVVERMLECQVEQGRKFNIKELELGLPSFLWGSTPEGFLFWCSVVIGREFNLFYKKYPKSLNSKHYDKV